VAEKRIKHGRASGSRQPPELACRYLATAQPFSVSAIAVFVASIAATRHPPLSCSAFSSDALADLSEPRAAAMALVIRPEVSGRHLDRCERGTGR
jgi:hypothetical protein